MGIDFTLNVEVGRKGLTLKDLRQDYDAVFLATGAWRQKKLGIEQGGAARAGLALPHRRPARRAEAPGRKVLVIGGGNVAVDVAISALRLGAREVTMACLEARDEMPAFPEDIEQARREKVQLLPSWGPHRVLESGGVLTGMELVRCTSVFDAEGRFRPTFDPTVTTDGRGRSGAAGHRAVGRPLLRRPIAEDRARPDHRRRRDQATNLPGVFAGGDVVTGPSSVVAAIAAGRRAADAIHAYLDRRQGKAKPEDQACRRSRGREFNARRSHQDRSGQGAGACRSAQRTIAAGGPWPPSTSGPSRTEAQRCVNCGCVAVNASDLAPAPGRPGRHDQDDQARPSRPRSSSRAAR